MNTYFALALLVAVAGQHTAAANCDIPAKNTWIATAPNSWPGLLPRFAIDNNYDKFMYHVGAPFIGANWFQIEFPEPMTITAVTYHTRKDCCSGRDNNIMIRIGNFWMDEANKGIVPGINRLCGRTPPNVRGKFAIGVTCAQPLTGRFVTFQQLQYPKPWAIAEVDIKGKKAHCS